MKETYFHSSNFKLTDFNQQPDDINYSILGLLKEEIFVLGELVCTNFYKNYDGTNFIDKVISEERVFTRDEMHNVISRTMNISWYDENDAIGFTKSTFKVYNTIAVLEEGNTRRTNTINQAKLIVMGSVGLENGFDLLDSVKDEIALFREGNTQPLKDAITASTKEYLNSEIKASIIDELTY